MGGAWNTRINRRLDSVFRSDSDPNGDLFNIIEGVINRHLPGVRHVYERAGLSIWDYMFLAWGAGDERDRLADGPSAAVLNCKRRRR